MHKFALLNFCLWSSISLFSATRLWVPIDDEYTVNIYDIGLAEIAAAYADYDYLGIITTLESINK